MFDDLRQIVDLTYVKLHWALWLDLSDDCNVWREDEWRMSKA